MAINDMFGSVLNKTWNATKTALKQISLTGTDFLDSESKSVFNVSEDKTHHGQFSVKNQYARASELDTTAQKILNEMKLPANIACLDLTQYQDARIHAFDKVRKENAQLPAPKLQNTQLNAAIADLTQLKAEINDETIARELKLFSLVNRLYKAQDDTSKALNEQFKEDKKSIETNTPDAFIKDKLITALKETHDAALEKFQTAINEQIKIQLHNARTENARLAFIQIMKERGHTSIQQQLDNLAKEDENEVTLQATGSPRAKGLLKNVDIKQLQGFKTLTGMKITRPDSDSFSINIPSRSWWHTSYHNGLQDNVLADLILIALAVKATGATAITISLSGRNMDEIRLIARKSVEANLQAGFSLGTGAKEKLDANGKSMETAAEKESRLGSMSFNVNGKPMPLISEKNNEGKVINPGVFDSKEHLDTYMGRGTFFNDTRTEIEETHEWKPGVSTGINTVLQQIQEEQETATISGVIPSTAAQTQQYRQEMSDFVATGRAEPTADGGSPSPSSRQP